MAAPTRDLRHLPPLASGSFPLVPSWSVEIYYVQIYTLFYMPLFMATNTLDILGVLITGYRPPFHNISANNQTKILNSVVKAKKENWL